MKRFAMKFLTVLVVLTFLLSLLPATVGAEPPPPSTVGNVQTPTDPALRKITSPTLREKTLSGGDEQNQVIVFMAAGTDLKGLVQNALVRKPMQGITYATGWTKSADLVKLASNAGVFALMSPEDFRILDDQSTGLQDSQLDSIKVVLPPETSLSSAGLATAQGAAQATAASGPPDWYGVSQMGATAAWASRPSAPDGFKGQGVIISHVDTGVDFGHPDLDEQWQNNTWVDGAWARVMDRTSPYYGWPMTYEARSADTYVATGEAFSADTVCNGTAGAFSWYADTSAVVQRAANGTAVLKQVTFGPTGACSLINKTYTLPDTSKSGNYHVGLHPDSLLRIFQQFAGLRYAAILVVDEQYAGVYDTVYVDWDGNLTFSPRERFTRDHPTGLYYNAASTSISRDITGDGIADVSAGLLSWIADGSNYIPGTNVIYDQPPPKPGSGNLVLWYGDFSLFNPGHGTATASDAVGRGVITSKRGSKYGGYAYATDYGPWLLPSWDTANHGVVFGTAPEAKIFATGSLPYVPLDALKVSALGYDGVKGTGDEAQVATVSAGHIYYSLYDGWDPVSRYLTFLNAVVGLDNLTVLAAAANGGFGYGTAATPGSAATAVSVGAVTEKGVAKHETSNYAVSQEWIGGENQILYGDLAPFSSRGPSTMAQTRPNVLAIGDMPPIDVPLNLSAAGLLLYGESPVQAINGNRAWTVGRGTSFSTPFAAGITALIYQAYKANDVINQGRHEWPTYTQAKAILMASANDTGNDPFAQGAGVVNADWATRLASGELGVYIDPPQWVLGNYRGQEYLSFANIINPGQASSRVFQVYNPTGEIANVVLEAKTWEEIGHLDYTLNTTLAQESEARPLRPDYLLTLYDKAKGINELAKIPQYNLADMIKVSLSNPYGQSSLSDPSVAPQSLDSVWLLKPYEWQDVNHNGKLWSDLNGNGVVNDGELDNSPGTTNPFVSNSSQEINEYAQSFQVAPTTQEIRIGTVDGQKPWTRLQERNADGLFIGLRHPWRSPQIPTATITVRVTLYREKDWPAMWFTDVGVGNTLVIPPGTNRGFRATFQADPSWDPGLYEGAILVKFFLTDPNYHSTWIPLLFNVALQPVGNAFRYEFGNDWASWPSAAPPATVPYDNNRIFGGQDWSGSGFYDQGDWRLFFADVATDTYNALPPNAKWIVDTRWVAKPTDLDTLVYGSLADYYSTNYPEVFGPYNLAMKGGSDSTIYNHPWGGWAYTFHTNTGGAREIVSADLNPGLNGIFLHNVLYGGLDTSEPFAGRAGYIAVNPSPIWITTTLFSGSLNLTFQSSLDWANGLGAMAYGLSRPTEMKDVPIHQGESWTKAFDVSNAGMIELSARTTDPGTKGIALYLDKWTGSAWQPVAVADGTLMTEQSIKVKLPEDGHYRARVYGFAVVGNGKFDFSLNVPAGNDLTVTNLPTGPIAANQVVSFTLNFDRYAATCYWYGVLMVGPAEAPSAIEIPVTIYFDTPEYVNSTKSVQTMMPDGLVRPGEPITYTLHFQNTGCGDARQAELVDAIPAGTTYVPDSATGGLTYDAVNNRMSWSGVLVKGTSKDFTFKVQVNPDVICRQPIANTAQFKDNWTGLLVEKTQTVLVRCSDLSITKTGTAKVIPGFPVNYTIAYANAGPDEALDVYVDDMLPAGVTYVSSNPAGVLDPANPQHVRWYVGSLANGASGTITLVGNVNTTVAEGSTLVNTATIATGITVTGPTFITPDPNLANNTATFSTLVPVYWVGITPATATVQCNQTQCYTLKATDGVDTWDVTSTPNTTFSIPPAAGGSWTGNCYKASKAGIWTVTGTYLGKSDTATLTVNHAAAVGASIAPKTITLNPRECVDFIMTARDACGNTWNVSAQTTFTGGGGTWTGNRYCATTPGTWTITGTYNSFSDTATVTVNKWAIYWILIFKNYSGGW